MSDRFVGESDRTLARWTRNGVLLTDGQAWARYSRVRAGVLEYLQGSATVDTNTWSATLHEFDLSLVSDGFERFFLWPASAAGYVVTEQARSSVYGFSGAAEHVVTLHDEGSMLEAIKAKTDLLGDAMNVTVTSPVSAGGAVMTLVHGDDYYSADSPLRAIELTNSDGDWPDLTGATVKLSIRAVNSKTPLLTITGAVITPTGAQKVRFDLTAAQTAALGASNGAGRQYAFDVQATLANMHKVTLNLGTVYVQQDATP